MCVLNIYDNLLLWKTIAHLVNKHSQGISSIAKFKNTRVKGTLNRIFDLKVTNSRGTVQFTCAPLELGRRPKRFLLKFVKDAPRGIAQTCCVVLGLRKIRAFGQPLELCSLKSVRSALSHIADNAD
jgi:hypothetical protein